MENRSNALFETYKKHGLLKIFRGFAWQVKFSEFAIQPLHSYILIKTACEIKKRYKISRFYRRSA